MLIEHEGALATILDHLPVMVAMFGPDGRVRFVNREIERSLGWSFREWQQRNVLEECYPDEAQRQAVYAFMANPDGTWRTFTTRTKSGDSIETAWTNVHLSDGASIGIGRDVTAEVRARRHADGLSAQLEAILENLPDMVFVKDARDLRFVRLNAAAEALIGIPRAEMLGKNDYDFFPESQARFFEVSDRAVLDSGEPLDVPEEPLATASGERILHTKKIPIRDADGTPQLLVGISRDITERKHRIEALERAEAEARDANRAKSEFLAKMSHEIRTPMNGVLGMASLLLESDLAPADRECVETIHSSGEALLGILNNILDLAKIEAGKLALEMVSFELRGVLEGVRALLRERAARRQVELRLELDERLPGRLRGDPMRLRQVLLNLTDNAVKFTERGHVSLRAEVEGVEGEVATVRLAVEDTGTGIDPEICARLFGAFEQADSSITRHFGGTGLGLTIAHEIVDRMGGHISVESARGRGTRFDIVLPFEISDPVPSTPPGAADPVPRAVEHPSGRSLRVLVAEDNKVNQRVVLRQLERLGCEVVLVSDGQRAVERHADETFDLVLMDCQMPVLDGYDATAAMRAHPRATARVPIIAMTASAMQGERERCLAAGMDDYLAKPVQLSQLVETLERWIPEAEPK